MHTFIRTRERYLAVLRFFVRLSALVLIPFRVTGASDTNLVFLADQHVDVRIDYQEGRAHPLEIQVRDEDSGRPLETTNVVLLVSEAARLTLPSDLPPFGNEGTALWLLPQTQQGGVLFLGLSAEQIPEGVFAGPLEIRLLALEGPGQFFLWQTEVGDLQFQMNTRDGIGPEDQFTQLLGGHSHFNWGFTSNGTYRLTFEASGRRVGETTNLLSPPTILTFQVLPLPPENRTPFQKWQETHWPGNSDARVIGPMADPDSDGQVNLVEYATSADPEQAETESVLKMVRVVTGGTRIPAVSFRHSKTATDTSLTLESAPSVTGPWGAWEGQRQVSDDGEFETVTIAPPLTGTPASEQFFRLRVALLPETSLAFPQDLAPMTP